MYSYVYVYICIYVNNVDLHDTRTCFSLKNKKSNEKSKEKNNVDLHDTHVCLHVYIKNTF